MKNKTLLVTTLVSTFVAPAALAQAAASPHTLTGNMTIATDYRFRGISQTFGEGFKAGPTIQGGIDYAHASGFYVGNWNSNVSGVQYSHGSGIEMDFYGGYKTTFGDFGLDVGTIYYYYPGAKFTNLATADGGTSTSTIENWEVYVGGSWKWFSLKYYYSFTNYFGLSEDAVVGLCNPTEPGCTNLSRSGDTKGTQYLIGAFNYEVAPKLTLGVTAGYTWVPHYGALDYFDYKVGLTYDLDGWMLGAALVGTDADKKYWYAGPNGENKVRNIGEPTIVLSVGKTF